MKPRELLPYLLVTAIGASLVRWVLPRRGADVSTNGAASLPAPLSGETPNYLLIDIDTLSPDHVGATRDGQPVTPVIDRLAAQGIRFSQAISQSGWTLPAVSSLLTGALPVPLRLREGRMPWKSHDVQDLAEIMEIYGYHTAAFWEGTLTGGILDQSANFGTTSSQNAPSPPTQSAGGWLETAPEPFLAFVQDIDLNFPLAMPGPYRFDEEEWPQNESNYQGAYHRMAGEQGEERAQQATLAHYDSVLHSYDARIGGLLDVLAQREIADHTVVIVTSNHSQDFFQHTVVDHGLLYDTNLRIPLVVVDPRSPHNGLVVDEVVQIVDIAPTILARSGIPLAASMVGQPLLPPPGTQGSTYQSQPVFSLSDDCNASLRTPDYKLILRDRRSRWSPGMPAEDQGEAGVPLVAFAQAHGISALPTCSKEPLQGAASRRGPTTLEELELELYALKEDPDELHNLVEQRQAIATQLLTVLLQTLDRQRLAGEGGAKMTMGPEQTRQIQEQGYWGLVNDGSEAAPPPGQVRRLR